MEYYVSLFYALSGLHLHRHLLQLLVYTCTVLHSRVMSIVASVLYLVAN